MSSKALSPWWSFHLSQQQQQPPAIATFCILSQRHPEARIEHVVVMENMTPWQQFAWWSKQSIVLLLSHASTNLLCFFPQQQHSNNNNKLLLPVDHPEWLLLHPPWSKFFLLSMTGGDFGNWPSPAMSASTPIFPLS